MKILHIIPSYIPAYRHGGAVKAVHELCKALVKNGQEIFVITTDIEGGKKLSVNLNEPVDVEGVKVIYCPVKFGKFYYYSKDLAQQIRENIPKFDIVHIHSVFLYPTAVAAFWCKKYKKSYVINPFGALDPSMFKLKSYLKKILYMKLIEQHNLKNAAAIQVTSNYEKEKFLSLGFNVPVHTVPRGLNLADYNRDFSMEDLRGGHQDFSGKKIILFFGRIHFKKGLDLLVLAFQKILKNRDDVRLVIAGPSENGYDQNIKRKLKKLGIFDKVLFTGMLLGNEKLNVLYSSDIFVLSSYGENFGISILEAMTCKLPVVITRCVGLYPDVIRYNAGIVTECQPEQIAQALTRLLNSQDLRKTMGENGRKLVEDRFTSDNIAGKMVEVYQKILNMK